MAHRRSWPMVVVILATLGSSPAGAASPGVACQATKLVAAGRKAQVILRCHASAAGTGAAIDADCVNRAKAKLLDSFAGLEAGGACLTTADATTVATDVDRLVFFARLALPFPPGVSRCSAARLRATARLAKQLFALNASDRRHPRPGLNDRETVVRIRYLGAFDAAPAKGDCIPTDTNALSVVESQMAVVTGRLFATCLDGVRASTEECDTNDAPTCPLQCNRDCTCPRCGDDLVNRVGEQCDGTSDLACPGSCRADCTCPPPVCGDGRVNQASEQCDPPDTAACAGLCQPDCTCPAPVCGNLVTEAGEQCEGTCPTDFGMNGCYPPGDPFECQCCALQGPCYLSDFNISVPCCPGTVCPPPAYPHQMVGCVPACTTDADCTGGQICLFGGCLGPFPPCAPGCGTFLNCEPVHNVCIPCTYLGPCV